MTFKIDWDWIECPKCSFHGPHQIVPKNKTTTTSDGNYGVFLKCARMGHYMAELPQFDKSEIDECCPECGDRVEEVDPLWYFCDSCELSLYVALNDSEEPVLYRACPLCGDDDYFESMHYHHWDYEDEAGIHVCPECHQEIHGGGSVSSQREEADDGEWLHLALKNLLETHEENFGSVIDSELRQRYNIPDRVLSDGEITESLREVTQYPV